MEREPRFVAAKVASQRRRWLYGGEGGFVAANLRPLISGFLVRCDEGTLRCGEVLRCGEPITLCDAAFSSFLLMFYFSVF